jgi:nucleoside-diphosphate-sugar epimerase
VARYGGYSVNMLHYEDAARLALAILRGDGCSAAEDGGNYRGAVFVGCDNHPLTFQEMVDACVASGQFGAGAGSVTFTGTPENGGGLGKVVTNDATRRQLGGWTPKYDSFQDFFLKQGGQDVYNSGAAAKAVAVGAPHQ